MAGITMQVETEFKSEIKHFSWVNWSAIAREEALKKEIFERFIRTGTLSKEDQEFCDSIDWYPVDELELKEEFIKELKEAKKRSVGKPITIEELDELLGLQ